MAEFEEEQKEMVETSSQEIPQGDDIPDVEAGVGAVEKEQGQVGVVPEDAPHEPLNLAVGVRSAEVVTAMAEDPLTDETKWNKTDTTNEATQAGAVTVVAPKGKMARKQQLSFASRSTTAESVVTTTRSFSPPQPKTWSEKQEARICKSPVPRHRGEPLVPGSFPVADGETDFNIDNDDDNGQPTGSTTIITSQQQQQQASQQSLVQAELVNPVFATAITEHETTGIERDPSPRKRRFWIFVGVNVALGILGLVLLLYFLLNKSTEADNIPPTSALTTAFPTESPTKAPPTTQAPTLVNPFALPETTWQLILTDPQSPQFLADQSVHQYLEQVKQMEAENPSKVDATSKQLWRLQQRFALALLYYATNSNNEWKKSTLWLSPPSIHECEWFSTKDYPCLDDPLNATTTIQEKQYTRLHLHNNGLVGSIPAEVFQLLPALKEIDLGENLGLTGTLATEIGLLQHLEILSINFTGVSGSIPLEFYSLASLRIVELSENALTGTLSDRMGALSLLEDFKVGHNSHLFGSLPSELGLLTALSRLDGQDNDLSGVLPSELGQLNQLKMLHMHENLFSGSIPSEFGRMEAMEDLRLYKNSLSGAVPSELAALDKVQFIIFEENYLTSTIPTELGRLRLLKRLRLADNQLTGTIPSELGLISDLMTISVQDNLITGTIAEELGRPRNLEGLLLHENPGLTGTIPSLLFSHPLKSFQRLLLYTTSLTGTIPSEIGLLSQMTDCWIHSNGLNGTLPSTMGYLTSLISLSLNDTNLSGALPSQLKNLRKLEFFNLSDTFITGEVPEAFCHLNQKNQSNVLFDCSGRLCGCDCLCPPDEMDSLADGAASTAESSWAVGWVETNTSEPNQSSNFSSTVDWQETNTTVLIQAWEG